MSGLAAGDLCEVVDHPDWRTSNSRNMIGSVVILVRIATSEYLWPDRWAPRWKIVGNPRAAVSEKILRKLPPPPADADEVEDQEELTV